MTFEYELNQQQRRCQAGLQRGLSESLEGHTTPLSVRVGRSSFQSPSVTPDTLRRAMESAGVVVPSVMAIVTVAQDLPSPTFSPRQIDVMERILRGNVPEDQMDALLDSVGLDNNQLTDCIAERPQAPPPPPPLALQGTSRERSRPPPRG